MGVYIKGMEMPSSCEQCWFFGSDSAEIGYCYLLKGKLPMPDGVPQDCPLISIPPHGRLIDADALKEFFPDKGEGSWTYNIVISGIIRDAPTVIPAEEGER